MFGGLCFMVNSAMCCGVHKDAFVARIGTEREGKALSRPHVRPMDITGRPLRGFVFVVAKVVQADAAL
jgi:hypothetical protein